MTTNITTEMTLANPGDGQPIGFQSLSAYLDAAETEIHSDRLETVRINQDAAYLSIFYDGMIPVASHYLEPTATWKGTYVRCLGEHCPCCKAGMSISQSLLTPVIDRLDGKIKVLRIPVQRGPGKFLTELGAYLGHPDLDSQTLKISRDQNYNYNVSVATKEAPD